MKPGFLKEVGFKVQCTEEEDMTSNKNTSEKYNYI